MHEKLMFPLFKEDLLMTSIKRGIHLKIVRRKNREKVKTVQSSEDFTSGISEQNISQCKSNSGLVSRRVCITSK